MRNKINADLRIVKRIGMPIPEYKAEYRLAIEELQTADCEGCGGPADVVMCDDYLIYTKDGKRIARNVNQFVYKCFKCAAN